MDRMVRGDQCRIYYKPFYTREDFSDERYSPVFSPTVYSGQTMSLMLYLDQWNGNETPGVAPYIRTCHDKKLHIDGYVKLMQHQWIQITFTIPDTNGDIIDEVGIILEGYAPSKNKTLGNVYLDEFRISGKAKYTIDPGKQMKNFASVTPFATDHGAWDLYGGTLNLMRNEPSLACTGNYYAKDYVYSAAVTPRHGTSHLIGGRILGAKRGYFAGLGKENKVVIIKNDFGFTTLAEADFPWNADTQYQLSLSFTGSQICLSINGTEVLVAEDDSFDHGMIGCGSCETGRTSFGEFYFEEH